MSADLKTLQARVAEAKGADRAIDRELAMAFGWKFSDGLGCWLHPADAKPPLNFGLPYFTSSLDAALALCERVLPEKVSEILHAAWRALSFEHALHMRTWKPEVDGPYAPQLARHVIAALLSALVAEQTTEEGRGGREEADEANHRAEEARRLYGEPR